MDAHVTLSSVDSFLAGFDCAYQQNVPFRDLLLPVRATGMLALSRSLVHLFRRKLGCRVDKGLADSSIASRAIETPFTSCTLANSRCGVVTFTSNRIELLYVHYQYVL